VGFSSSGSALRLGDGAGVGCIISYDSLVCSLYFFFTSVFRGNWVQLTCLNETGPDRHESS
jgi:hypothetical protein